MINPFKLIGLYFAVRKLQRKGGKMKTGWKTTEFWVTVFTGITGILGTYGGMIPEPWGLIVTAVVACGYTISRGLAKVGAGPDPTK